MRIHNRHSVIIQTFFTVIMENITEALSMGGYGFYVWGSYTAAAIIIIAMLVTTMRSLKDAQKKLKNLQEHQD